MLPGSPQTATGNSDAAAAAPHPGRNDPFANSTMQLPLSSLPSGKSGQAPSSQGGHRLAMGTSGVEASAFAMGIREAAAATMDADEAIDFLGLGLEDLCEDSIGIGDSDEDLDLDGIPESIMANPFDDTGDNDAGIRYFCQAVLGWSCHCLTILITSTFGSCLSAYSALICNILRDWHRYHASFMRM